MGPFFSLKLLSWSRSPLFQPRFLLTPAAWTQPRRTTPTTKGRSGTTRSQRTTSWRRLADPPSGCGSRLAQSPTGGPAGEGMRIVAAGAWGAAAARGRSPPGKASGVVRETGVKAMRHIPQRHCNRTGRRWRANHRRRGGRPPAKPQVRRKKKEKADVDNATYSYFPSLLFVNKRNNISLGQCSMAAHFVTKMNYD